MKKSRLDKFNESMFCLQEYNKNSFGDNSLKRRKILDSVNRIIDRELTERQRICLKLYFFQDFNLIKISKKLKIYPSTAWRHINKAKIKIGKTIRYCFPELSDDVTLN
jgi:DNA-directed RNA polymerase specialized sigma subunit